MEFGVGMGVHQGSVLSLLLFIIVLEALSREFRTGCPWELLYTDDLMIRLVCTMRHRLEPSCQNINNNLTGSSEFTLQSLLPVDWQQLFDGWCVWFSPCTGM